ncbi:GNAT family N-acetyltransferase [Bosea sp. 124]|uniref:GNAT family N-acetyltransferase n=1 Tax=Bosea sp. 124 TaxID=2135642 RepID=UPI000D36C78E|nr:GNAT family N-acetyltransferase [Bosea sp. 124]PTM42187.1 N-acetylglutamate synthase-like GNAT family acetyltransferase [Bosea sp. 124]
MTALSCHIRKATPADQPRIHAIRMGVSENVLSDPSRVTDQEIAWYREQAVFLVADDGGEVVAFSCANHQTGLVWALFVDPAHEGRGHGRALLDAALERLKAVGHAQAHLSTGAGTRAERFYRRHGWRDMGRDLDGQIVFVRAL